uniref:Putative nuclear transcription factor y subunit alpha-like aedes albopictus n=2 Tax=Lutzomyia longipalpis TaxID=7200 RepID=A0A1B0CAG7_LUTLO
MMASPGSLFRGRKVHSTRNGKVPNFSADELNTSSEQDYTSEMVLPTIYGQRGHLMTLPYNTTAGTSNPTQTNRSTRSNTMNCFTASSTISTEGDEDEVERRNQINRELSTHPVATIFRERGVPSYPRNFLTHHHPPPRARSNPRSLDRRRIIAPAPSGHVIPDPSYSYAEPVFHDGLLYDPYLAHDRNHPYPYILPEFTTFRNGPSGAPCQQPVEVGATGVAHNLFGRDSSFGSDSGYSQHTQTSTRSGWGRNGRKDSAPKNTPFSAS